MNVVLNAYTSLIVIALIGGCASLPNQPISPETKAGGLSLKYFAITSPEGARQARFVIENFSNSDLMLGNCAICSWAVTGAGGAVDRSLAECIDILAARNLYILLPPLDRGKLSSHSLVPGEALNGIIDFPPDFPRRVKPRAMQLTMQVEVLEPDGRHLRRSSKELVAYNTRDIELFQVAVTPDSQPSTSESRRGEELQK